MVHKKSAYRLNYKNISNIDRQTIWTENCIIRESRKHHEMSHHSIDEELSNCECDESDCSDNDKELPTKVLSVQKTKIPSTSLIASSNNVILRDSSPHQPSTSSHSDFHVRTQNRGVLKFSPIRGEYDLIPAVGENRPSSSASSHSSAFGRSRSMHTLNDRGVINIRPVTRRITFEEKDTTSRQTFVLRSRSTGSDGIHPSDPQLFHSSNLMKSRRKTPITAGKQIHYTSDCKHCGKSTHSRIINFT